MDSGSGAVYNKHSCSEYDSYLCKQILVSAFATGIATNPNVTYAKGQSGPMEFDEFGFPVWIFQKTLNITLPHDGR